MGASQFEQSAGALKNKFWLNRPGKFLKLFFKEF